MNTDTRNRLLEALGIAEGIAQRLRQIASGEWSDNRTSCEYGDMARTLKDIEDRLYHAGEYARLHGGPLYRTGQYAPENVARVKGGAR